MSCAYVAARAIFYGQAHGEGDVEEGVGSYGAVLNPAIALGIQFSTLFNDGIGAWQTIYLYPTVPMLAAFLGTLFFDRVYARAEAFLNANQQFAAPPRNQQVRDFSSYNLIEDSTLSNA